MIRKNFLAWSLAASVLAVPASAGDLDVNVGPSQTTWRLTAPHTAMTLTVELPDGTRHVSTWDRGSLARFQTAGLPDGTYSWEMVVTPELDARARQALASMRGGDRSPERIEVLRRSGVLPTGDTFSGVFTVMGGQALDPTAPEPGQGVKSTAAGASVGRDGGEVVGESSGAAAVATPKDVVYADDVIVDGSLCVGFDCVNGENFGFDTIRLKENNTRIKFDDTSSSGSFPNRDWQLTANDSGNGEANKFSIDDVTGGRTPFTIEAGAATSSLVVDSSSRIGLRTATPVLDLHIATGNTPGLRLEQNTSSGFNPQTWDIAGNEANFFVRDVTNGSRLPFRIRPGAPTSSIDIAASGNVGFGTASPSTAMHLKHSAPKMTLENTSATDTTKDSFSIALLTNGVLEWQSDPELNYAFFDMKAVGNRWQIGVEPNGNFKFATLGQQAVTFEPNGDVTILGTLNSGSSRTLKEAVRSLDPKDVLQTVVALPVHEWSYLGQATRHVGPMAEDFYAAFGVGIGETRLAPADVSGVALLAIQGLHDELESKEAQLERLEAQNQALLDRLTALEALVAAAAR